MIDQAELQLATTLAREDPYFFTRYIFARRKKLKWLRARHHQTVFDHLRRVVSGEIANLLITMPPRYSKTESVTSWVAHCFGHWPDCEFLYLSYAMPLARENSGVIRQILSMPEYRAIFPSTRLQYDSRARDHWKTTDNGVMYSAGADGSITGFGAGKERPGFGGAVIVDDPLKASERTSETRLASVIRAYQETIKSRRNQPERTPIIVIAQRLAVGDLPGFILSGRDDIEWTHLNLPAIDASGAALWPEKHSLHRLELMRETDPVTFAAQYMQQPVSESGGGFRPDMLTTVDALPTTRMTFVRGWDLAATAGGTGAYTVGVLLARCQETLRTYVVDVVRFRGDPYEVENAIRATASRDPRGTLVSVPQDPGQAGVAQVRRYAGLLNGFMCKFSLESGDKVVRAGPFAAQVNAGNVVLMRAPWNDAYITELRTFPHALKDQVDASSRAYSEMDDTIARFRALAGA